MADEPEKSEPYTILGFERYSMLLQWWRGYYESYTGRCDWVSVEAPDELGAYKEALKKLRRLKRRADKRREANERREV